MEIQTINRYSINDQDGKLYVNFRGVEIPMEWNRMRIPIPPTIYYLVTSGELNEKDEILTFERRITTEGEVWWRFMDELSSMSYDQTVQILEMMRQ